MKLIAALCVSAMMAFGGFGDPAKEPKYTWVYDCAPESLDGRLISQWGDPRSPAEQAIVYVSAQAQPCRPLVENEIVAVAVYGPGFATGYPVEWRTAGGNEFGVRLDINRSLPIEAACLLQSNTVRLDCYSVVWREHDGLRWPGFGERISTDTPVCQQYAEVDMTIREYSDPNCPSCW